LETKKSARKPPTEDKRVLKTVYLELIPGFKNGFPRGDAYTQKSTMTKAARLSIGHNTSRRENVVGRSESGLDY